jgi:hypothetical protein
VIKPPAPLEPLPTVILMAPALPPIADQDPMDTEPELPQVDVPLLNLSIPLAPPSPEFAVRRTTAPLVLTWPPPPVIISAPPVFIVHEPAETVRSPPAPLLPLPTVILTAPDFPPVARPDPMLILPLVPELDVPELKTRTPAAPTSPELPVLIVMAPLVVYML